MAGICFLKRPSDFADGFGCDVAVALQRPVEHGSASRVALLGQRHHRQHADIVPRCFLIQRLQRAEGAFVASACFSQRFGNRVLEFEIGAVLHRVEQKRQRNRAEVAQREERG